VNPNRGYADFPAALRAAGVDVCRLRGCVVLPARGQG